MASGACQLAAVLIGFGGKSHPLMFQTVQAALVLVVDDARTAIRIAAYGETWNRGGEGATK
jgi:hypothetical protein